MKSTKWFINECLDAYRYDPKTQQEHFPNDHPTPYDTKAEACAAADRMEWELDSDS